ncbi:pentapeptide repeat-containing protein [Amycolatopsis sp. Hca4]|uniref:pentapeptide repeat-containing protein n=1 Tax=Amycolatopsis sp. Hca4 TaxID=2742131 RepID=UPI001592036B|nr:pentapeptide repeat-containing protein [Amycolatopsis sp. Hca4]QKV74128.1 pentapeptide repeat-containing protein [Amycolatopsis sp. Hca4]
MPDDASRPDPRLPALPRSDTATQRARLRELSPRIMWLTAAVIAVLTAGAVVVLWWAATAGLNGPELVSARLDALKVGLSVAVGSGGVVALYLSWRRQHSTEADLDNRERTLAHQEHDAAERRLTELYLKAVEQLGSPQAAVRHGGLYALERVAQDNPRQRQTVVNVICAYLRNPYVPPPETSGPRPLGVRRPLLRSTAVRRTLTPVVGGAHVRENQLQEREVRLTAQRILKFHLLPGMDTFWHDIEIDLTGATLIGFSFNNCTMATAAFNGATFTGAAWFVQATFTRGAWFGRATFTGDAWFDYSTFAGNVQFDRTTFAVDARFSRATFNGGGSFRGAAFTGGAGFNEATFTSNASFSQATFTGTAAFRKATFADVADFDDATFNGESRFDGTTRMGLAFNPIERYASLCDEDVSDPREGAV